MFKGVFGKRRKQVKKEFCKGDNSPIDISNKQNNVNFLEKSDYVEKTNKMAEEKIVVSNAIVVYDLIKQANIDNSIKVNN